MTSATGSRFLSLCFVMAIGWAMGACSQNVGRAYPDALGNRDAGTPEADAEMGEGGVPEAAVREDGSAGMPSYDFGDASRIFQDGTPVLQMTSEADRVFRMSHLIRTRPVDASTFEVVNFIPVDLHDVLLAVSIAEGPSDVQMMRILHLPAHAIVEVEYPFITYAGTVFRDGLGAPVDLSPYRAGVSVDSVTIDFAGDDPVLHSLERVRSVGWEMKIHDFDADNSPTNNWTDDPTPLHARLFTQHMINLAYIWTDERMPQRLASTTIIGNDGVAALSAQDKQNVYSQLLKDRRLNLGVVANVSGLGGGTTFGLASYILNHDFLYGAQDGSAYHEMGHVLGYSHASSMTYPDDDGVGFASLSLQLARELFKAGDMPITQANYYKPQDHQHHCNSGGDCPWYMSCTGTTYSDGSFSYCE